jgi:hypothetical protein
MWPEQLKIYEKCGFFLKRALDFKLGSLDSNISFALIVLSSPPFVVLETLSWLST